MEDEEPAKPLMDYLNQPLFKTVSTTAEMHRMELPLLILERQVGKAEGAESQPSPAELLVATLSLLPLSLLGKAGSGAEHSAVPGRWSSSPPSLWDCSSLAEPGPGRGMSHPALEAETVWEGANKIKRAGDPVSVFLKN